MNYQTNIHEVLSKCPILSWLWVSENFPSLTVPSLPSLLLFCCCVVAESYPTFCDLVDYSPLGSSVHGIFQARILKWVAISFSRSASQPRDQTHTFCASCIDRQFLHHGATTWLICVYSLPISMYMLPFWENLLWTHKIRFPITNCPCHLCIHNNLNHNIYVYWMMSFSFDL